MRMLLVVTLAGGLAASGPAEPIERGSEDATSQEHALTGGTWQQSSYEDCYILYSNSCYARSWEPQCYSYTGSTGIPAGKPCPEIGAYCWWVRDSRYVVEYECR